MKFPLTYEQVQSILSGEFDIIDLDEYDKLYEYYSPEMPYGTAKARTGDPGEYMLHQMEREFGAVGEYAFGELYG